MGSCGTAPWTKGGPTCTTENPDVTIRKNETPTSRPSQLVDYRGRETLTSSGIVGNRRGCAFLAETNNSTPNTQLTANSSVLKKPKD